MAKTPVSLQERCILAAIALLDEQFKKQISGPLKRAQKAYSTGKAGFSRADVLTVNHREAADLRNLHEMIEALERKQTLSPKGESNVRQHSEDRRAESRGEKPVRIVRLGSDRSEG